MKCLCNHCSTPLEFDEAALGEMINCPSCGLETQLYEVAKGEKEFKPKKERTTMEDAGDAVKVVATYGLKGTLTLAEALMKLFVAIVLVFMLGYGYLLGGMNGLLLGVLIIVTYSGLDSVRKEIRNLRE